MTFKPQYYLYYDNKSGDIYQVSHVAPEKDETALEITLDEANDFLSLKKHFHEHQVSYIKNKFICTRREDQVSGHFFRNYLHEWISDDIENPKCQIIWNLKEKYWRFSLSEECKDLLNSGLIITSLTFFVTLDTDFDFLVRTIIIDTEDLLKDEQILIPFESKFELDINKISISTSTVFDSYGLKVCYE